jgi:CRP-like cAMP-binding protein
MSEKIRKLKEDASRLIAKGKLAEACECYEKIVKTDHRDLTARQKVAELYARLGRKEEAVHAYQSVAGSYAADGLLLKAIAVCKIILQLDPTHKETQNILADLSTKRRGDSHAPAGENVVEMPKRMSAALPGQPGAKKSANSIRGVSANHIRGGAPSRTPTSPGRAVDLPPADGPMILERGSGPSTSSTTSSPSAARGQIPAPSGEELQREAASMLPASQVIIPPPPPDTVITGTPLPTAPPRPAPNQTLPDDLPIDISFDDSSPEGEAVVVGHLETPRTIGAPILTAAIAAATPSFDELMAMTAAAPPEAGAVEPPAFEPPSFEAHAMPVALLPPDDGGNDEVLIDDGDDANVVELAEGDVQSARVDVDRVPPIPLFSDLPRDAFVALTERMELRIASVDDALIQEGEAGTSMFIIIQGRVKVVRSDDGSGGEIALAELSDGAFFGEMALLSDAPRTASVVAVEETMLFEISREMLASMTTEYPSVGEVMKKFHKNRLITNLLKTSPIFQPFSTTDKKLLIEKFKSRQVTEGTLLVTREKPGDGLYVILSGRAEVLDHNKDGKDVVIAELREGDVFGEMSMLWNKDTCASVRAQTPCVVLRLPRQSFGEVIMTHPQILETLAALSEKRQKQNQELKAAGIASDFLV